MREVVVSDSGPMQALAIQLIERNKVSDSMSSPLLQKLGVAKPTQIKCLYLWGGVRRGKSCLMHIFFQ